ncbi:MAG: methylated-DNA--[protein]-cysteine S-methyltransferase [Phycisphaerales bacterium]|nr:MAG: methylated-DNA--[protein]-cysteine S-methyltransferase [Phycisphaerales bacterium]
MIRARRYRIIDNPLGRFVIRQEDDGQLRSDWMGSGAQEPAGASAGDSALLDDLAGRLRKYFAGEQADFSDVPLPHGTAFQQRCWRACQAIPRGETRCYAELAKAAGSPPGAARAAGQAMRNNPLPVIVPCHRVIAGDGRLHGFAGQTDPSGRMMCLKARLLQLEGAAVGSPG